MAHLDAFLLCDAVARDAQSGKWILTGVFTTLWAPSFPATHPSMDAFFRLRFDPPGPSAPVPVAIAYQGPAGTPHRLADLQVRPDRSGLTEGYVRLQGLRLDEPGTYRFMITVGDTAVGGTTIIAATTPAQTPTVH